MEMDTDGGKREEDVIEMCTDVDKENKRGTMLNDEEEENQETKNYNMD